MLVIHKKKKETYSTRDSLVVTHPTTSLAIRGLSMGERTGSRIFHYLWPYVLVMSGVVDLIPVGFFGRRGGGIFKSNFILMTSSTLLPIQPYPSK